jgi:hypothetical protein
MFGGVLMNSKFDDTDMQELKDLVRIGVVSSVNKEQMTARVKIQEQGIVTGDLRIVQNTPLITVQNKDGGTEWNYKAEYTGYDRDLGLGETYKEEYPDTIVTDYAGKEQTIKIYPWIPYIGQWVLCIFKPDGDGDGFIIGGI